LAKLTNLSLTSSNASTTCSGLACIPSRSSVLRIAGRSLLVTSVLVGQLFCRQLPRLPHDPAKLLSVPLTESLLGLHCVPV
jgi:hypothetical protein